MQLSDRPPPPADAPTPVVSRIIRLADAPEYPYRVTITPPVLTGHYKASIWPMFTATGHITSLSAVSADQAEQLAIERIERDILGFLEAREPRWLIPSGIYSGKTIDGVPDGYLAWTQRKLNHDCALFQAAAAEIARREEARSPQ
jgi:hypothetical protein